ncbi:MAG: hypothetical protein NTV34_11115 [Proteobacteria bacterium]|nr:hypothetical protein [Pseudomonadota bacterium]
MTSAATSFWHLVQQKSPNGPRKISWPWILVAIFLPVLGSKLLIGRFASGLVALSAWVGAEFAVRRGMNPLAGPWARAVSPRGEFLRMLWPLWRLGFALNVLLVFGAATFLEGRQWVIFGTLTPWVIFTSLGVLSAILHNLAGSPARLEKVLLQTRHIFYLIIGFGPFGVCCILGSASVLLIRLWSKGDRQLTQIRSRRMGQYVFRLILRYLEFIGFIRVRFKDLSAPSGRARLLIGNHISMFDIITILAHVEQCGTFVKEAKRNDACAGGTCAWRNICCVA